MGLEVTCEDALSTVTYVQAWTYWASGGPDNDCLVLWGMSLRWWGRIGQLVAFTGSLLLVADLVDLPGIADSFRELRATFKRAGRDAAMVVVFAVWFLYTPIAVGIMYLYCTFWKGGLSSCFNQEGLWQVFWQPWALYIVSLVVAIGGGIAFALLLFFIVGYVIPEFILAPLIWGLRTLPRWAKAINLLLIIVAFHFSLLAS